MQELKNILNSSRILYPFVIAIYIIGESILNSEQALIWANISAKCIASNGQL